MKETELNGFVYDKNIKSQDLSQSISTRNTVICSLVFFLGAVKYKIELLWPICSSSLAYCVWVGGGGGGGAEEDECVWGSRSQGSPEGGLDGNVEARGRN